MSPKHWNLRPSDNKNGETTRIPRLITSYQKVRKETEDWGDYTRLTEEIPDLLLTHGMLLGGDSVVHTPKLKAFETNERRMAKFSESMDPNFIGRKAAVLHHTQFAYVDESTRRRMSNAATPKPGSFEGEQAKLGLAPIAMRKIADLQEAALIIADVRPELVTTGKLLTRTALAPFVCEEVVIRYGEFEDRSAGELIMPKVPNETISDEQGPSGSGRIKSETMKNKKTVNRKKQWSIITTLRERMTTRPRQVVR